MLHFWCVQDTAGSIRDAGGAFSKRGKAQEEQYFRRLVRNPQSLCPSKLPFTLSASTTFL